MARKRRRARYSKLDPCKVHLPRLKRLSSDVLMKTWSRLAHTRFGRTAAGSTLVGWLANYATAKKIAKESPNYYDGDAKQRRHAIHVYLHISRQLEREFVKLRAKKCPR